MFIYHIGGFFTGFILDIVFGDPYWMPHSIKLIGNLIDRLEKALNKGSHKIEKGRFIVCAVLIAVALVSGAVYMGAYKINPILGYAVESFMTYQILAMKCLKTESMKVYQKLINGTLEEARFAVSMIVGRDTSRLSKEGITKATVETVAENTSDGVIAPMIYMCIGGPFLGFIYKAINTMDSMIGYKNERYIEFGRAAAKTDDTANYIPARISGILMIAASFLGGKAFDGKRAWKIYLRDRRKHASPNSAQTESACAGALGIQLAGNATYFGKEVKKPYIGDKIREIEPEDIVRTNKLMYITGILCHVICLAAMCGVYRIIY